MQHENQPEFYKKNINKQRKENIISERLYTGFFIQKFPEMHNSFISITKKKENEPGSHSFLPSSFEWFDPSQKCAIQKKKNQKFLFFYFFVWSGIVGNFERPLEMPPRWTRTGNPFPIKKEKEEFRQHWTFFTSKLFVFSVSCSSLLTVCGVAYFRCWLAEILSFSTAFPGFLYILTRFYKGSIGNVSRGWPDISDLREVSVLACVRLFRRVT